MLLTRAVVTVTCTESQVPHIDTYLTLGARLYKGIIIMPMAAQQGLEEPPAPYQNVHLSLSHQKRVSLADRSEILGATTSRSV